MNAVKFFKFQIPETVAIITVKFIHLCYTQGSYTQGSYVHVC